MTEGQFKAGDRVLINGALVADIEHISYEDNILVHVSRVGGGENRTTAHISNTTIQHIVTPGTGDETHTGAPAVAEADEDDDPKDELTTSGSL